jgi:hypothetical protein
VSLNRLAMILSLLTWKISGFFAVVFGEFATVAQAKSLSAKDEGGMDKLTIKTLKQNVVIWKN